MTTADASRIANTMTGPRGEAIEIQTERVCDHSDMIFGCQRRAKWRVSRNGTASARRQRMCLQHARLAIGLAAR